jgi:hypothetical protein
MRTNVKSADPSEILRTVSPDEAFLFFDDVDRYTGTLATSLADFSNDIRTINPRSVAFHFKRGDFERWVHEILHDATLARRIRKIKKSSSGKKLRGEIAKVVKKRLRALQKRSR